MRRRTPESGLPREDGRDTARDMTLFVPGLIRRKRDGGALGEAEIRDLLAAYTAGAVPDYQMSALLMAILFRGLDDNELGWWTDAMIRSGTVLDHGSVPGAKVDKHSTGGVGDKISLSLAPAVAALGVPVPMISGRGLGHTGGTLDKLEAIPGFRVDLPPERASALLRELGLFMIGQTADLVPADRALYALRDVTGTVESIPLIASSIMSKKIAEGIDGLVLDVKAGAGAFMADRAQARLLAGTLIRIGQGAGLAVRALLTNMEHPIGRAVGNALEVREAIDVLRGGGPPDTAELTRELGAEMALLGGAVATLDEGRLALSRVLADGSALDRFSRLIEAQGGDPLVCDLPERLPAAEAVTAVTAPREGYVRTIGPREVARAALEVGAGRRVKEDRVDPATGVLLRVAVGEHVVAGQPLAELHHRGAGADAALHLLAAAFSIDDAPPPAIPLVFERL
jgi:pyrimidine-nucleoside phosphorylase